MNMPASILTSLLLIGIVTGLMAGLFGIGGAIIMIPSLVFFMGFNQQMAQGTSLAVMLPPIGIFAAYNYYKAGQANIKFALILAVAFIIGSFFGSRLALNLPAAFLKKAFAVLLIGVALKMLFSK